MKLIAKGILFGACVFLQSAYAEEGFRTHFATAGTLGETLFDSNLHEGQGFVGIGYKEAQSYNISDGSGNNIAKLRGLPLSYSNDSSVAYLYGAYTAKDKYADGTLTAFVYIPNTSFTKKVTLGPGPGVPLATNIPNSSGNSSGLDDIEIIGTWDYKKDADTKYTVGLALTVPTGSYSNSYNGASIGQGYYTLKPSFSSITQAGSWSYAYKATLGINSNNDTANYQSGNLLSLEAAVGYKTGIGAFGFKVHALNQIANDSGSGVVGNSPSPFRATSGVSAPASDGNNIAYTTGTVFYVLPLASIKSLFYVGLTSMFSHYYSVVPDSSVYYEMRLTRTF